MLLAQRKDGSYTQALNAIEGIRYAMLSRFVSGTVHGTTLTEEQAHLYGTTVAKMHHCLDRQKQRYMRKHLDLSFLLDEPLSLMALFLAHHPEVCTYLTELAARLKAKLEELALPRTPPAFGICHGDLHKQNILLDEQGQLTLMDWDCVGYCWRAYDLAILRWSIGPLVGPEGLGEPRTTRLYEAYLHGYSRSSSTQSRRTSRHSLLCCYPSYLDSWMSHCSGDPSWVGHKRIRHKLLQWADKHLEVVGKRSLFLR